MASPNLRIAETFASVQGEGIWVGVPSWFIRISGCPMRCWWCDTPYASWSPEGPVRPVESIAEEAMSHGIDHVVITGGEPMAFPGVELLTRLLADEGKVITIETAGIQVRDVECSLMSLSPKLSHSAPDKAQHPELWERHEALRLNRAPLIELAHRFNSQVKIVVNPEESDWLAEVEELASLLGEYPRDRICLMAEGRDSVTLHRRERLLTPVCMERGWRLSPRLHIDLFGDTRGT